MSYIGTQPTPQSLESRQEFTATASQTTFATSGYTVGYVDIYLNGVKLSTSDFTATNGSDIVLGSGAAAGDVLAVVMKNDHSDLVALPITDSQGNNVLSESGGTVTLTADEANVGSNALVVDASGNVGIKTSSPSATLHVDSQNTTAPSLTFGATSGQIFQNENSELAIGLSNSSPFPLYIQGRTNLNAARDIVINPLGGNCGIGTSSPIRKLTVSQAGTAEFVLQDTTRAVDGRNFRIFYGNGGLVFGTLNDAGTAGTDRMVIDSSGNIGAPSGTNIYNASDQRLKQNITDLSGCLQKVLLMRGVSFNWIDKFCDSEADKTLYGLIAQELQTVDVNLVDSFSDNTITAGEVTVENPLRVNEKFIIPMLVESIKEQQTLIESQQSQIDALTARIEALETV